MDWSDIEDFTKNYPIPDYGFTPDGEFPGTNREKGYSDIQLSFPKGEGDKRGFEIISLEAGSTANTVLP